MGTIRFGATSINFSTDKPFPSPPPGKTGWERMPMAAMCWRAFLWHADLSSVWPDADPLLQREGVLAGALQGYYGGKVDLWGHVLLKYGRGCRRCF